MAGENLSAGVGRTRTEEGHHSFAVVSGGHDGERVTGPSLIAARTSPVVKVMEVEVIGGSALRENKKHSRVIGVQGGGEHVTPDRGETEGEGKQDVRRGTRLSQRPLEIEIENKGNRKCLNGGGGGAYPFTHL